MTSASVSERRSAQASTFARTGVCMTVVSAPLRPHFRSGIFPKFDPCAYLADDASIIEGMLLDNPRAWRAFKRRFDRLVLQQITKVTRQFRGIVAPDDVDEIYASFY